LRFSSSELTLIFRATRCDLKLKLGRLHLNGNVPADRAPETLGTHGCGKAASSEN
jgi:hypothetical protein